VLRLWLDIGDVAGFAGAVAVVVGGVVAAVADAVVVAGDLEYTETVQLAWTGQNWRMGHDRNWRDHTQKSRDFDSSAGVSGSEGVRTM